MLRDAALCFVLAGATGCHAEDNAPGNPPMGIDCSTLARAARRAAPCDPALAQLAAGLANDHDERRCRIVARQLLQTSEPPPMTRSLFEHPASESAVAPLSEHERSALLVLDLPAELTLIPDLAPGPGVPPTTAQIKDRELDTDERGRLHAWIHAGRHTLQLRHAGDEAAYCVDIDACDHLSVTAHGSTLAGHSRVLVGTCGDSKPDDPATVASRPR